MKILILDCDWLEGVTLYANPWAMKLSSAFKQAGDEVFLARREPSVNDYDRLFVFKEKDTHYLPKPAILLDDKARLVGDTFDRYPNKWSLPLSVKRARPDYYLYPDEWLMQDDYVCMSHNNKLINYQPFEFNKHMKRDTVVLDNIWELEDADIIKCLDLLLEYSNIWFREPINFLRLNEEIFEKLVKLSFSKQYFLSKKLTTLQQLETTKNLIENIKKVKRFKVRALPYDIMTSELSLDEARRKFYEIIEDLSLARSKNIQVSPVISFEESSDAKELLSVFVGYDSKKEDINTFLSKKGLNLDDILKQKNLYKLSCIGWGVTPT